MRMQDLIQYLAETPKEAVQEEFRLPDGTYDLQYISSLLKDKRLSKTKFNLESLEAGLEPMEPHVKVKNEVSLGLFLDEYVFGKYENVRGWINHFSWKHKKLLTKEALFLYILDWQTK